MLSSTDLPQTVKMSAVHKKGASVRPFQVAIYEDGEKEVRFVKIDGQNPMLYTFKGLTSIKLTAVNPGTVDKDTTLIIESTKPLSLSR
jgi:hypothetical protein